MNLRKDYQKALDLRLQGKTYGEIRKLFDIPKSTLSVWFKKLSLSVSAKKVLEIKRRKGFLLLGEFNKQRTQGIEEENTAIVGEYVSKVGNLSKRELMLLGAALYWAEGYKNFGDGIRNKKKVYPHISFSNSDPSMIIIFLRFLKEILQISKEKVWARAMLYPGIDPTKAITYWQKVTGLPLKNFRYYIALSRASSGKRPKNLLPYGTLQLRIQSRPDFFKIKGLIDGIIQA